MRMRTPLVLVLSAVLVNQAAAQSSLFSFNEFAALSNKRFEASAIGWYFTPTSSFFLTAINTRFSSEFQTEDRTVTAEIWSDRAAAGGTLLRSGDFQSSLALGQFGGGSFESLWLEAGVTYFIGFRNVSGLGRNSTDEAGTESLGYLYYSEGDPQLGDFARTQAFNLTYNPSFALSGVGPGAPTTVTPEPVSMVLMGTGLLAIGGITAVRRRRAQKKEQ